MNVVISDEQSDPVEPDLIRRVVEAVLHAEGCPDGSEVSVTLVDEAAIERLHVEHLCRPGPTDVLSFPIEALSPGAPPAVSPGGPPPMLGDVVLAPSYIRRQAARLGVAPEEELALLAAHGTFHLLGYDHEDDSDAEIMEGREREILARFGWERR